MCVMSMVGDFYRDKWNPVPSIAPDYPPFIETTIPKLPEVSKFEFDQLKKEVLEMKELLKRAKKYDEENNQKDCEIDDKMDFLRKVAKLVGIDLDDVIPVKPV